MKKVLAMVLAVFMLVSVLCVGVSADADESAFAFVADSVTAFAGQTVDVTISTRNNPGIVGLRVTLGYDESVLTPVDMVAQDFATASFGPLSNPLSTTWVDAISPNNTTNGVIAKITFQVAADAPVGEYPLTVGIVDSEDIFDADFNAVPVITVNGAVNVVSYTPGDVNNDGKVNVRDLGLLQQSLNGWSVDIVKAAADVTGDDKINVRDLGLLQQSLNGWNVELLPGGSALGGGGNQPGEGGDDEPVDPPVEDDDVLTIEEAIAMGSAMEHNVYTEDKYYVTGVITEVYNTQYGNMKLADDAGNILTIYGTYSADGELRYDAMEVKPVAGDTVTIYGIVGQYNGTAQIKNGWIVDHIPGEGGDIGGGDEPVDPPVGDTLSIADAIAIGSSMAHNTYTEEKYYVTGVITEVYNTVYGNMKITDDAGNILTIYGTFDADGTNRYDAMEVKPVAGDTVTIYGIVGQYSDAPQIKNGWIVEHIPGEGGDEPVEPPVDVDGAVLDFTDKANRVSYSTEQQVWAQNGITVTNDKGASTSNVGDYGGEGYPARFYKSSTVTIEAAGMTQLIIDCNGLESKYVNGWVDSITDANATGSVNGTQVIIVFTKPVDSFTWETLSAQSRANSITVVGEGGDIGGGDEPVDPPVDPDPDVPVEPVSSATIDFTDKANRVSYSTEQQVWAQNGITVTNDKAASSSNVGDYGGEGYPVRFYQGSSVLVEYSGITEIAFYCDDYKDTYAASLQSSITSGNVTVDGTVVTASFDSAVNSLYIESLAAQVRVLSIAVNGGSSGEGSGDVGGDVGGDIGGDDVVIPDVDNLSIADAIALGTSMAHNTYTEQKYYVTGTITEVYNSQYGNMYITDGEGNTLTIYGTFGADGEIRYDALEVKPVAGDIVTIYGAVGQYNGAAQIKNGWIVDHVKGEGVEPAPELSVEDAPVAGVAYKFGMIQGNVSADTVYYLNGAMSSYYMATTTSSSSAIDVYLEETAGGYYLYTMDEKGTKAYINMVVSDDGLHVNGQFGAATATTVYTFDTDSYTLIAEINGAYYWFGTRSDKNYTTVGPCNVEYAGFFCQLYA